MGDEATMVADVGGGPESARAVFPAWERLRVAYNALLGLGVVAIERGALLDGARWPYLILSALGANVCFCAGPVAEGYLDLLGVPRRIGRWLTLGLGGVLAVGVTFASSPSRTWRSGDGPTRRA